jgi:hypothetical protein
VNPVRRDVVNAGSDGQQMVIRWVTDNSGPWIFHWYDIRFYRVVKKGTDSELTVTLTGTLMSMRVNLSVNHMTNPSYPGVSPWYLRKVPQILGHM